MSYENNPRRLHGKINIVYADSEVSKETKLASSGDAEISAKEQVFGGYILPDLKACTMDGNSTMGGGFQMQSPGFVMGWWSSDSADEVGEFSVPFPYLEMTFTARPIIRFTVIGDAKLGQLPVDFEISCFSDDTLKHTEIIKDNMEMTRTVFFDPVVIDVNRIRLTIKKWNTPNARVKILQFFDILEETYDGNIIKDMEVLEQLSGNSDGLSYTLVSNSATFTLYNENRKFDRGYLKDLVLLDRKVEPYIGVENDKGIIEWTSLGVFYSDEWSIPQNDQFLKLKTVDRLLRMQNITYVGYPYTIGATLYDIAEDILLKSGLNENQFEIDELLKGTVLPGAFLQKKTTWEALQEVAVASMSFVYVDRNNKIRIVKDTIGTDNSKAEIDPSNMFSYEQKTTQNDFSNYIEIDYSDIQETPTIKTVYENTISIEPYGKMLMQVDYSNNISSANLTLTPLNGLEIEFFDSGVNAGKFSIKNTTANYITTKATVGGYLINTNKQTVVVQDLDSIQRYGTHQFYYFGSELIQTYSQAYEMGEIILARLKEGNGNIKVLWRGKPSLLVNEKIKVTNRFEDKKIYKVTSNKLNFDGGLKEETNGYYIEEVKDGSLE